MNIEKTICTLDNLTFFPNRLELIDDLNTMSSKKMMIIDIDKFSDINSMFSEIIGDEIIRQFAHKISQTFSDLKFKKYHLGGDSFAVLVDDMVDTNSFKEDVVLFSAFVNPIKLKCYDIELSVRASIGAVLEDEHEIKSSCLVMAFDALKLSKISSKNYHFYNSNNKAIDLSKNLDMLRILEDALDNNKVICYYQQIQDLNDSTFKKYEALVRIKGAGDKIYQPCEFMDVASSVRLYLKITSCVVKNVIKKAEELPECFFSINLSYEDLKDATTKSDIIAMLNNSTCAERLTFEILESIEIENSKSVNGFLQHIRKLGCKVAIDDFGTGYSNFAYLLKLQVDFIKLDGSLIKNIDKDENAQKVVKAIIAIASTMNIKVITEYVCSKEVYDTVKQLNTDFVQGNYISKPIALDYLDI